MVGLGNPGKKYEKHRHNVGFMAVDRLQAEQGLPAWKEKFSGVFSRGTAFGEDVMLLKPMTFMNVSGDSVQPAAAFVKADPAHACSWCTTRLDLPFGDVRLKVGGGHAGHNGLRSIIERMGADFARLRVGVGRPPPGFRGEVADFVLSSFDAVEAATLPDVLGRALDAIRLVVEKGLGPAQNVVNTRKM